MDWRIPFFEEAEDGGGRVEPVDFAVLPEDDAGEVAAVGIAKAAGDVVVVGEEDGGVGGVGGVLEEEAVDGLEEDLGLVASQGELAAEVGLEVGHEKSCRDAFAGDVADDESESLAVEGQEVVVVAAHVARLKADAGVVEGFKWGKSLREEAGLDLAGDLELLCGAAVGLDFCGGDLALLLDLAGELVSADQLEAVAVHVLETSKGDSEDGLLRRLVKAHAVLLLELVGGVDVLREEADLRVATDETVFVGAGFRSDKREDGLTIGRGDGDPTAIVGEADIGENAETKLLDVEIEAAVVIADVDGGLEDAQVGVFRALRTVRAC